MYTIVISEYYLGFFKSLMDGKLFLKLLNTISKQVHFTIEAPVAGLYQKGVIESDSELIFTLPFSVTVFSNDTEYKGIYVRADSDALIVIGQNEANNTSETFLAIPYKRSSVIREYVYYGISVAGYSSSYQSAILIVGTEDNTTMKLTVTQTATTNTGNTLYTGREYSFVINRLQTFYIRSTGDLSGTKIVTDKQVSVFSGHELAQIPEEICCGDHLIEQVPSVTSWGREFYTMPLATRKSYSIKILAAHNMTKITVYCNNLDESHVVNEGQYLSKTLPSQEYCVVYSDKPILVVQFGHGMNEDGNGDPMMTIIPDILKFSNSFPVTTIGNNTQLDYEQYINIIVLAQYYQPDMIHLILEGRSISLNAQEWIPIRVKHNVVAYATQVNVSESVLEVVHLNKKSLMIVTVYGFGVTESYGHPGQSGDIRG